MVKSVAAHHPTHHAHHARHSSAASATAPKHHAATHAPVAEKPKGWAPPAGGSAAARAAKVAQAAKAAKPTKDTLLVGEGETAKSLAKRLKVKDEKAFVSAFRKANPHLKLEGSELKLPAGAEVTIPKAYHSNYAAFVKDAEGGAESIAPMKRTSTGAVGPTGYKQAAGPAVYVPSHDKKGHVHGYTQVGGARPSGGGKPAASAQVNAWIDEALRAMGIDPNSPEGQHMREVLGTIIQHESGGNPSAINLTDSNARAGHPSQGLMQTIPSTFKSYALPGHGEITNPVDNIIAGARYAMARYGSLDNVPGVKAVARGGSYVGY